MLRRILRSASFCKKKTVFLISLKGKASQRTHSRTILTYELFTVAPRRRAHESKKPWRTNLKREKCFELMKSYNGKIKHVSYSKRITDKLDENIPLEAERGYHVHFKGHDHLLSRPVIFLNRGFGITPMEQGLRVVGTVEFGGLDNPLSKKRILNLVNNAKYLFPDLKEHEDEWLGFRPTLPDFLPVMGPSKNNKNLFYSFGHHHLGWTLGAISGKIVSGMIAEENTNLNLTPYSSLRFS